KVLGVVTGIPYRDLVGPERALDRLTVHLLRARPALGRHEHDHRPVRPARAAPTAGLRLDPLDLRDHLVEGFGHGSVHGAWLGALDEPGRIPVALEQGAKLAPADPRQDRRIGDLVAVQMEYGE